MVQAMFRAMLIPEWAQMRGSAQKRQTAMTMAVPSIRGMALALSLGMHALLLGGLLLLGREAPSTKERVYRVTLAEFAPAAGSPLTAPAAPAVAEKPAQPEPAPQKPDAHPAKPAPSKPEAKKISPIKNETAVPRESVSPAKPPLSTAQSVPSAPAPATTAATTLQAGSAGSAGPQPRTVGGIDAYACDVLDQRPSITRRVEPEYPTRARRMSIQGSVRVRLVVDSSGQPRNCEVVSATPDGHFEEAALKAAKNTRFAPGKLKGQPVNTLVELPFIFRLR